MLNSKVSFFILKSAERSFTKLGQSVSQTFFKKFLLKEVFKISNSAVQT